MGFKWSIPSLMVARHISIPGYLLNDFPNAAVAYSLRLLKADYEGSAIRVRRNSDDAEQDIGFINRVLDTTSLLTFIFDGGDGVSGYVTKWYDQSGNGRDLVQATEANQMIIVDEGVLIENGGNPAIEGLSASYMRTSQTAFMSLATHSDFFAFKQTTPVNNAGILIWEPSIGDDYGQNDAFDTETSVSPLNLGIAGGAGIAYTMSATGSSTLYQLVSHIISSGSGEAWQNGTSIGTDSHGGFTTMGGSLLLGARFLGSVINTTYSFQGYFQEMIVYASDQSANRTGIQDNINSFYSIF